MNKKTVLFSIILATLSIVAVSCNKNRANKSDNPQHPFEDEGRPIDDSFLEGEWLCPEVTTKHNPDGSISREWVGAGSMTFDTNHGKVHLYDGCNYSSAEYTLSSDSVLSYTGDNMWTEAYCPCYAGYGGKGKIRRFVEDDTECIELNDGYSISRLFRPGRWFLRGEWELAYIDHEEIEDADIRVSFNLEKGITIVTEEDVDSFEMPFTTGRDYSITIDPSVLTKASLSFNKTWQKLADMLPKVTHYEISASACACSITFYDQSKQFLFRIERTDERIMDFMRKFEEIGININEISKNTSANDVDTL